VGIIYKIEEIERKWKMKWKVSSSFVLLFFFFFQVLHFSQARNKIYSFGRNDDGQACLNYNSSSAPFSENTLLPQNIKFISIGDSHTLVLLGIFLFLKNRGKESLYFILLCKAIE